MTNAPTLVRVNLPDTGDFNPSYFDHVLAEYELLDTNEKLPVKVQKIIQDHESGIPPKAGDLYLLEKYVIQKQSEPVVRARLTSLRLNYRGIVGADAYAEYLQSGQASQPNSNFAEVKADAGRLLDTLHWAYTMVPECEEQRAEILKTIVHEMFVSVAVGLSILLASFYLGQTLVSVVVLVMLMGALGGFLSVQQRIAKISTEQDPILTMFQLKKGLFTVRLAPLTGALSALALFLIFQGGLLTGAIFPEMTKFNFQLGNIRVPKWPTDTALIAEFATMLVWCFIAGFAERFVPDTLDKLVARQEQTEKGKVPLRIPQSNETIQTTGTGEQLRNGKETGAGSKMGKAQGTAGRSGGKIESIEEGRNRVKGKPVGKNTGRKKAS
jgi:hypothetical protein